MGENDRPDFPDRTMIVFIGIQGSGKSYYYHKYLAGGFARVNLDELKTRNREKQRFEALVWEGSSFVVDNTNPQRADRARYIIPAKEAGYHVVGYFFESRLQDCIRRNERRTGRAKLPAKVIAATSNKLELPSFEEGFDELFFIARRNERAMIRQKWREADEL
jgi:predicted kinase